MRTENVQNTAAIIVAAGNSERMDGIDKVFALLDGKPVLARVVNVFEKCDSVQQIVVVVHEQSVEKAQQLVKEQGFSKVTQLCAGGERRQDSVSNGLSKIDNCERVIIHDGARPLVTADMIEQGLEAARETGAAAIAVPVKDTIKMAMDDMIVQGTPPRKSLWAVQTPQVFRFDIITEAYRQSKYEVTDDASLVEQVGYKVKLYQGSYDNIKITTPDDMALADILVRKYDG